jgi:hypothetical protein
MPIAQVILFGTGSPLLLDVEESLHRAGLAIAAGIFTPAYRQQAAQHAARLGLTGPYQLIDPSVTAPRRLELSAGCYVNTGCTLGSASCFGPFVLVNRGASIGHHVSLGAFVSLGPGVVIAGQVTIGTGTVIGAGATTTKCLAMRARTCRPPTIPPPNVSRHWRCAMQGLNIKASPWMFSTQQREILTISIGYGR